jgi:TRAP-type C4-dicarboxylate transport system permease large subunit
MSKADATASIADATATVAHMSADHLFYASMALIVLMTVALAGVLLIVCFKTGKVTRDKDGVEVRRAGRFSRRSIQLLATALVLPTIALLSLNGFVSPAVLGTLFGTFIGYVLSGVGEEKKE